VVAMVTLGSASMICLPFSNLESESKSAYDPGVFVSANNDCLE
jgi:hypothetical protein